MYSSEIIEVNNKNNKNKVNNFKKTKLLTQFLLIFFRNNLKPDFINLLIKLIHAVKACINNLLIMVIRKLNISEKNRIKNLNTTKRNS